MHKLSLMMTWSNGNIFRVTGHLCGEFTGPGEFPTQRPVTRSFGVFFDLRLNKWLSKRPCGWWFETPSWSLWRQCNEVCNLLYMLAKDIFLCIKVHMDASAYMYACMNVRGYWYVCVQLLFIPNNTKATYKYRCDGFVVACSTVGCLCDNPRGAGGYDIVTMTTLRRNCCRFGEVFRSWLHWELSCWQFPLRSAAEIASKWRFYLGFFYVFGNNLWAFLMSSHIDSLIINPPSIIVLRYHLIFYFTLSYFHIFHFKYCSYEYYS